jgi:hypothetical protein
MEFHFQGLQFEPTNANEFTVEIDWTQENERVLEVATDRLVFVMEARDYILNHLANIGAFEGIPLGIKIGTQLFNFFVDLSDNLILNDTTIEATIKKRKGKDKYIDDSDSTTFALLKSQGFISDSDMINTPLIVVKDDQLITLIVLGLTSFTFLKATFEQIRKTADLAKDLVMGAIPDPVLPAGVVIKVSFWVGYALKVLFELAYTIALFLALKNLVEQIVELIFPKLRYLKCMKVKKLMEAGCAKFGYSFQSTILDQYYGLAVLPIPRETRTKTFWDFLQSSIPEAFNLGYPTESDTIETHGKLRQAMESYLNVGSVVMNDTVFMEDETYWQNQANTIIASNLNLQSIRENSWTLDTSGVNKRYSLAFSQDPMDLNSYDRVVGKAIEVQTEPIQVVNADLVSIPNAERRSIPFALGARKGELNWIEKQVKKVAQACDALTGSNFVAKVDNRKGVLQISQQFFGTTKLLWIVGDRQPDGYLDIIGAPSVYNDRHITTQSTYQTFRKKAENATQFTETNFQQVLNNKYVLLESGETVELLTLSYTPRAVTANITYRIKSNDAFNTKTITVYED